MMFLVRHCVVGVLALGLSAPSWAESSSATTNGSWSAQEHEQVLRFRSAALADRYISAVHQLAVPERVVLARYDQCAGHIDRSPTRLSPAFNACRQSVMESEEIEAVGFERAVELMEWRDDFRNL